MAVAAFGCGASDPPEQPGHEACDLDFCAPAPEAGAQLALDAHVRAGEERTYCKLVRVDRSKDLQKLEHRYTPISHHLVVYATLWDPESLAEASGRQLDEAFACNEIPGVRPFGLLYIAQGPEGVFDMPEGVTYPIRVDYAMIEYHVLNATPEDADASVRLNLEYATEEGHSHADTLFFYNYDVIVPPSGSTTARMQCAIDHDMHLIAGTSHMHSRGVAQRAKLLQLDGSELPLFDTTDWVEPEIRSYDPPVFVPGGSVFDFSCDYQNPEDRWVTEGQTTEHEMCMAPFVFYQERGAPMMPFVERMCFAPGMGGPVYQGSQTCMETTACMGAIYDVHRETALAQWEQGADDPAIGSSIEVDVRSCRNQTRPESSPLVHDLYAPSVQFAGGGCRSSQCMWAAGATDEDGRRVPGPCWFGSGTEACTQCMAERCPEAWAACEADE